MGDPVNFEELIVPTVADAAQAILNMWDEAMGDDDYLNQADAYYRLYKGKRPLYEALRLAFQAPPSADDKAVTAERDALRAENERLRSAAQLALRVAEDHIHDQYDGTSMLSGFLAELNPARQALEGKTS